MASITAYSGNGIQNIKELIRTLVNDLTGSGTPAAGTAAPHMKLIYPTDGSLDFTSSTGWADDILVIIEATTEIDPFADPAAGLIEQPSTIGTDPWRIAFHSSLWTGRSKYLTKVVPDTIAVNSLAMYVGTPSTISVSSDGTIPTIGWDTTAVQIQPYMGDAQTPTTAAGFLKFPYIGYIGRDMIEPLGNIGAKWTNTFDPTPNSAKYSTSPPNVYSSPAKWDGPNVKNADELFVNKYITVGPKTDTFGGFPADSSYGQPNSYRLVLSDHGLFIGIWGPDPEENGKGFSWVLIQRPVDKKTGIVRGVNPLNGSPYTGTEVDSSGNLIPKGNRPLFCVNSVNGKYWKFVVREHDNPVPSSRKNAAINTTDSGAVINPYQQQSLTENGEYVITFLNNLNSSRFKYSDELDMLGTVSSDVVGGGSQINVSVYSEIEKRAYHALWSSGSFGTKMRIMVVADIPTPNQPWGGDEEPPVEPPVEEPPVEEPPVEEPPVEEPPV